MGLRRSINRKGSQQKPLNPNPDILQTRPFSSGKRARESKLPTTQDILQTRPFSPRQDKQAPSQEMPDIQAQLEATEKFGYNWASIPAFAPTEASPIQAKLSIGEPNDQYEQEADRVAAQVVSQINSPQNQSSAPGQTVQREDMLKEDEEPVQTKLEISAIQRDEMPPPEEEEEPVQAKLADGAIQRDDMPPQEEEEEPVQAKLADGAIQRDEMPPPEEEEEPVQAKLADGAIQRDEMPPEEEEPLQAKLADGAIQRDEMPPEEEEEEPVQAKLADGAIQRDEMPPEEEEEEPVQAKLMVQRKSGEGGMAATPDLENSIESARGSGQSLSENIREPMEQAFGADFSGVKVHTDGQSDQLNQSIQARAFTTGQDIFFRQGQYEPGSKGGQELLAHELTHVVQQNGGAVQRDIQENTIQRSTLDDYSDPSNPQHDPGSLSESDIQATDEYQYLLQRFFPQQTPGPTQAQQLILACRLALRYIRQNQVSIDRSKLETFFTQAQNQVDVTNQITGMVGQDMAWVPSSPGQATIGGSIISLGNNNFAQWALAASEATAPPVAQATTINCWEMLLLAAYKAGRVSWQWIHDLYTANIPPAIINNITNPDPAIRDRGQVELEQWVNTLLVNTLTPRGTQIYHPNTSGTPIPLTGDIVFFDRAAHVVLSTGNRNANGVEVYTFWPPPNISHYSAGTIDEVKTSTIEELSDWITVNLNGGRPPTVEFGTPAWS